MTEGQATALAADAKDDVGIPDIFLLGGRDKRLRGGHPWVYSNEIRMDAAAKAVAPGSLVTLRRVDGKALGTGTFNPHTLIAYRQVSADATAGFAAAQIASRLAAALALRERLYPSPHYRLVHGEADGLPGLVVDRFGDTVVLQCGTAGADRLLPDILDALDRVIAPAAVVLRNDGPFRDLERLDRQARIAKGAVDEPVAVIEGGLRFAADPVAGQKTGWFFDQRDNRAFVAALSKGTRVLDLYCHSGGFALSAAAAGAAAVRGIDTSGPALDLARRAAAWNGLEDRATFERANVFEAAAAIHKAGERFDVVVADPPAFVKSRRDLGPGLNGYRKLTRMAAGLVTRGGFLFVASCSHNVDAAAFSETVARGINQAGRRGRILRAAGAGADHPVHPHLAESAYLTTLTLQLD